MRAARLIVLLLLPLIFSCARPRPLLPLPPAGEEVAVFPPNNRTGDDLLIAGASFLEKYALDTERITVPEVLAAAARVELASRGYEVVPAETVAKATGGVAPTNPAEAAALAAHAGLAGQALYIEIRRWEADVPLRPSFVVVSLQMTLVEAATGKILWQADHPPRPVQTPGVANTGEAYIIAARRVVAEMLGERKVA